MILKKMVLKRRGITLTVIFLLLIFLLLTGCSKKTGDIVKDSEGFPVHIVDDMGRNVVIDREPQRIISLAPSNTEILFALNLGERIAGVTEYCDYPQEANNKEKIGGFSTPNIEKVISLNPDLVIATSMHQKAVEELERLGVPVIVLFPKKVSDVLNNITLIGRATGQEDVAEGLVKDLKARMDAVTDKTGKIPEGKRPRVYYEVWHDPLITAGPDTFVDDLITLAGGINIAGDSKTSYPEISLEVVIQKDPQIFIYSHHGNSRQEIEQIYSRQNWQDISAIKNKRVYIIDQNLVQRATPRLIDGLEELAKMLHPDLF
jgi:iron complex transport system substrate-binding protein